MQQPADIGGELLCFGAREQHAVIEGMQITAFGDPMAPLHQFLVHDGDLASRPAETDESQPQPIAKCLCHAD